MYICGKAILTIIVLSKAIAQFVCVQKTTLDPESPHLVALLVSSGPVALAQLMANLTERTKRSMFYPFHKDGWKTMSGHLVVSAVACIVPVYVMVHMLLAQPGQSFYFWLRG